MRRKPQKRISDSIINISDVIAGYLKVGSKVSEEYNFKCFEPINKNLLIVDNGTYSGIEVENIYDSGKKKIKVFRGGLYIEEINGENLSDIEEINEIYGMLVEEDKLNVDIFQNLFICLSDYGIRGKY